MQEWPVLEECRDGEEAGGGQQGRIDGADAEAGRGELVPVAAHPLEAGQHQGEVGQVPDQGAHRAEEVGVEEGTDHGPEVEGDLRGHVDGEDGDEGGEQAQQGEGLQQLGEAATGLLQHTVEAKKNFVPSVTLHEDKIQSGTAIYPSSKVT